MDDLALLRERIAEAPFEPGLWPAILLDVARLSGGWSAQLFGMSDGQFSVDVIGGYSRDLSDDLNKAGGANPLISPRARAFLSAQPSALVCDADYLTVKDRDRHPIYRDFFEPVDGHYCTNARMEARSNLLIGLAINHSRAQGPPSKDQRAAVSLLLPALQGAIDLQVRLENRASALMLETLDAAGLAAFILDGSGHILSATRACDDLLATGAFVRSINGALRGSTRESDDALQFALGADTRMRPNPATIFLRGALDGSFCPAKIAPIPSSGFSLRASALVILELARPSVDRALLDLGLTKAEADVARAFASGMSPAEIALAREVGLETVRTQIKAIYAKLGARHQAHLAAKLRSLT